MCCIRARTAEESITILSDVWSVLIKYYVIGVSVTYCNTVTYRNQYTYCYTVYFMYMQHPDFYVIHELTN